MSPLLLIAGGVAAACGVVVIRHHRAYVRRARAYSFGAFLETGGWTILLFTAVGALVGGLAESGMRIVESASALVGLLFIGVGRRVR